MRSLSNPKHQGLLASYLIGFFVDIAVHFADELTARQWPWEGGPLLAAFIWPIMHLEQHRSVLALCSN